MIWMYSPLIFRVVLIFCAIGLNLCPADAGEIGEWRAYGSDNASTKYAPLDQINTDNVTKIFRLLGVGVPRTMRSSNPTPTCGRW